MSDPRRMPPVALAQLKKRVVSGDYLTREEVAQLMDYIELLHEYVVEFLLAPPKPPGGSP